MSSSQAIGEYFGMRNAVTYSGRSAATLRRAVKAGVLRAYRVGLGQPRYHRLTFRRRDLDAWLQHEPAIAAAKAVVDEIVSRVTRA